MRFTATRGSCASCGPASPRGELERRCAGPAGRRASRPDLATGKLAAGRFTADGLVIGKFAAVWPAFAVHLSAVKLAARRFRPRSLVVKPLVETTWGTATWRPVAEQMLELSDTVLLLSIFEHFTAIHGPSSI